MKKITCTIIDAYNHADNMGRVKLYTDNNGVRQMLRENSFYVWTEEFASATDTAVLVFAKDLAVDSRGLLYCVDGVDVQILE